MGEVSFAYVDEGPVDRGAATIVALHGLPGSHRDFRWLAAAIDGRARLVRVDLPGFGATRADPPPADWPGIVAAVRGFIARVADGPHVVLGHSFGAPLATRVVVGGPACGLAWLAPVGLRPHRMVRRVPALPTVARLARAPVFGRALLHAWRAGLRATGFPSSVTIAHVARTLDVLGAFRFEDHARAVASLRVPVFAAWTEDDAFVEPEVVRELCAAAPSGVRIGFATGGHNLQKTQAVEIADALVAFARECRDTAVAAGAGQRSDHGAALADGAALPLDDGPRDRQSRRPIPK